MRVHGALEMDRREFDGGLGALVPSDLEDAGFSVLFTERSGGVSTGVFRSLNFGLRSGDDIELVRTNRRRACSALGVDEFAAAQQVHGSNLANVDRSHRGSGFMDPAQTIRATDGLVTDDKGVALAILTADCVPIALGDPTTGRLAVVHAGWRGIAAGVVGEAIKAFGRTSEVRAAIGPAIGPDHYEVGEDVASAVASASPAGAIARREGSRILLDLPATVARILEEAGVRRISLAGLCTACETDRFFSHRRDGRTGRQAVVAVALA